MQGHGPLMGMCSSLFTEKKIPEILQTKLYLHHSSSKRMCPAPDMTCQFTAGNLPLIGGSSTFLWAQTGLARQWLAKSWKSPRETSVRALASMHTVRAVLDERMNKEVLPRLRCCDGQIMPNSCMKHISSELASWCARLKAVLPPKGCQNRAIEKNG